MMKLLTFFGIQAGKKFMQLVANYTAGVYREINGN